MVSKYVGFYEKVQIWILSFFRQKYAPFKDFYYLGYPPCVILTCAFRDCGTLPRSLAAAQLSRVLDSIPASFYVRCCR
jgi:hypothetical protein